VAEVQVGKQGQHKQIMDVQDTMGQGQERLRKEAAGE